MFRALAMTACDLSACAKPWKIQYETVKVIFQEFYAQVCAFFFSSLLPKANLNSVKHLRWGLFTKIVNS